MTYIAAKPTFYKGVRFRSRLEARWAVFFDATGKDWIYEPTFPELQGLSYQPDFLLNSILVEVKPWPGEQGSWADLAAYLNEIQDDFRYAEVAKRLQSMMVVMVGAPGVWAQGQLTDYGAVGLSWFRENKGNQLLEWAECEKCGRVELWPDGFPQCCPRSLPTGPLYEAFCRVRDHSYEDA